MIKTNCKDCAFAIYDNNKQTSCAFDRINVFGSEAKLITENEEQFYTIDRLCTYYRNKSWGYKTEDKEKVLEESSLKFDIVFDCDNINKSQEQIITHFINSNTYYSSRLNIYLLHEYQTYDIIKQYVSNIAKNSTVKVNISICDKIDYYMHQLALKSTNGYHAIIKHPEIFELDSLRRVNECINTDLKKFIVCNIGGANIISNITYKMFHSISNSVFYAENIANIIEYCKTNQMYIEI